MTSPQKPQRTGHLLSEGITQNPISYASCPQVTLDPTFLLLSPASLAGWPFTPPFGIILHLFCMQYLQFLVALSGI